MSDGENKKNDPAKINEAIKNIVPVPSSKDLEKEDPTSIQKAIEKDVENAEQTFKGSELSTELSKDRTHMSEHRTKLSEHRTDLSEHRTGLSEHRTELSEHRTALSDHRTNLSDERTGLSFQRTALSYERTLMSWIRTATSLISFGFTIYKFFEEVSREGHQGRFLSPRVIGMVMIGFGFLGLLFAQIQHERAYKQLRKRFPEIQKSLSSILSALVLAFGLLLFIAALFRQ
jgi:putative membrane protein